MCGDIIEGTEEVFSFGLCNINTVFCSIFVKSYLLLLQLPLAVGTYYTMRQLSDVALAGI